MTLAMAVNHALIESLWQGAVVALTLAVVLTFVRTAQARYIASCLALAALTLWPIAAVWNSYSHSEPGPNTTVSSWTSAIAAPVSVSRAIEFEQLALPLWLAGLAIGSARLLLGYRRMDALRATAAPAEDLRAAFDRVGGGRFRLAVSKLVDVPSVVGHWRPVILVPTVALTGLSTQQLDAILAHELAHLRRGDHWVNMLQCWIEVIMFYHPAAWWISSRIRHERELCCDDAAVAACGDATAYARALWTLEKLRIETPRLAVASNGGSLLYRIERLSGASRRGVPILPGLAALACAVALLPPGAREVSAQPPVVTAPAVQAQPQAPEPVAPPPPATAASLAPKQVTNLKAELESAYQDSLREQIAYQRDVHSASPMLDYNAPELGSLFQRMADLRRASEEIGTATNPEDRMAAEVRARAVLATVQTENARLRKERASVLEGPDRIFGRTIRGVTFEGVPDAAQAWFLESVPNFVGQSYTGIVATTIQSVVGGHLPKGCTVQLKREDGFEVTIVIRGPAPQARSTAPVLVNAAYQQPPDPVPTARPESTGIKDLDDQISLAMYWAGWEAGFAKTVLDEEPRDLWNAVNTVHQLSRDVPGYPFAEAALRETLARLYAVVEQYRQRRISIEGKDQRPTDYRRRTRTF